MRKRTKQSKPEVFISDESKGEGVPQAVKTKDEVPGGQNRRVDEKAAEVAIQEKRKSPQ